VLYEELAPYAGQCVVITTACLGSVSRSLGQLAAVLERFDDAERHFDQALQINERIRSPLWVAHTKRDYALMLLRRDGPGDRARARALLGEALAAANELGLHAVARKAEPLV
jgi:tetratricopeptide (TPR) repeat protein